MSLPTDILREIFSYLSFKECATIIPLVSRHWDEETTRLLRCIPKKFTSTSQIRFNPGTLHPANAHSFVRAIERSLFSQVTEIIFNRAYESDQIVIRALLMHCPHLTHFEFNAIGSANPFALLTPWPGSNEAPQIASIKFFRGQTVTTNMIESMTMCLPNLRSVWFYKTYCNWADIDFLEQYVENIEYDSTGADWKSDFYKWKRDEFWEWSQPEEDSY